jgi:transposase
VARKEVRTFGTMTADLLALTDWLVAADCPAVAMESTGSFWQPLYNLLEGVIPEILVVNAAHIKQVPGRKTDVKDAEWIADLLRHGLLRASFIPDRAQRELRELTRYRVSLIQERSREVYRLQKTLEGGNIKLSVVAKDLTGVSARAMLAALLEGRLDAAAMAQLARGKLRAKIPQLAQALVGLLGPHQRAMIAWHLAHIDDLDAIIEELTTEVTARVRPFVEEATLLDTVSGIGLRTAEALIAEIGVDMTRFPDADHLTAWAGLAPGNNERAGKRKRATTRKGSPALRAVLVEAAHAAGRSKDTYLGALYHRLAARMGKKRAAVALARKLLIIIYHILTTHEPYHELGATYLQQRDRQAIERRLVHRLQALGYDVVLQPKEPAA